MLAVFASLAWLLGAGLAAARVARGLGVPDLPFLVAVGVLLGPGAAGLVHLPVTGDVGQLLVSFGAVFLLYEGGRSVDLALLRRTWLATSLLATVGVAVTAAVVALSVHVLLGSTWAAAALAGAAVAATDPAAIVPLFQQVRVSDRVRQLVVGEAAFNDATGAIATTTVLAAALNGALGFGSMAGGFARLVLVGGGVGIGVGLAVQLLVAEGERVRGVWTAAEESGVASLLAMATAYTLAVFLGGSGFMAVFLAGLVRSSAPRWGLAVPADREERHDSWMSLLGTAVRILIFGLLGANVDLRLLFHLGWAGLAVAGVLLFVARPLCVLAVLPWDPVGRWRRGEVLFVAWVRETGVVPAALASLLLAAKAPGASLVAGVVFLAVVGSVVVQMPTTAFWARRTGVAR